MPFIVLTLMLLAMRAEASPVVLRGTTMGTTYHIKYVPTQTSPAPKNLHAEVEKLLAQVDRQMSTYRPDSELSRFNRAPASQWFAVSPATAEVTAAARAISEKTSGAIDVTVGPLVRLWHFGPPEKGSKASKRNIEPPSDEAIDAARDRVGYDKLDVRIDPPALRKSIDGLEVDLSSIASGYTIDRIADLFLSHGVRNFMIEIGGEVRALGKRPDGTPWRVAIERPIVGKREMQLALPLVDAAIATAGGTQKFFEFEGRRYSHIIDPATGRPVQHNLASVTVVADTCIEADGWDTPLLVLGPDRGFVCAEKNGIAALFILEKNGRTETRETSAWKDRFANKM
jgi:thiamine biosynthesis lipoprotein